MIQVGKHKFLNPKKIESLELDWVGSEKIEDAQKVILHIYMESGAVHKVYHGDNFEIGDVDVYALRLNILNAIDSKKWKV